MPVANFERYKTAYWRIVDLYHDIIPQDRAHSPTAEFSPERQRIQNDMINSANIILQTLDGPEREKIKEYRLSILIKAEYFANELLDYWEEQRVNVFCDDNDFLDLVFYVANSTRLQWAEIEVLPIEEIHLNFIDQTRNCKSDRTGGRFLNYMFDIINL